MTAANILTVDGRRVAIEGERNLLEVIRKAHIELPTFCYHSELSVYGACRLCIVEIEGRGVVTSCSTIPEPGMVVKTQTAELREMRKVTLELMLASHDRECPSCERADSCKLQALASRLGVDKVRYKAPRQVRPVDHSSPSIVRDPNKCVLCGDCVRMCDEVQGIGALDFCNRGSNVVVAPAFNKDMANVECVNCGQCIAVCPTGALTPRSEIEEVWEALQNPEMTVVVQVAPAVRVALGEVFGMPADDHIMGRMVTALRLMGFDKVFDTSFTADLTILEEANEFLARKGEGGTLPLFTSCCPAWVKLAEQDFPELLPHISTCRSPQQMFGSLAKEMLPAQLGVKPENLVVVSVMPCTAKKFEARRREFRNETGADVDFVLTTRELARMIKDAGLMFRELESDHLDMPFGMKTGAGIIFGNSGGVSEAVLRYVSEEQDPEVLEAVRGAEGIRELTLNLAGGEVRMAVVSGLRNARQLAEKVRKGEAKYDFIEVMACPGGCIGGAGQPVSQDPGIRRRRTADLREADAACELRRSQENVFVQKAYAEVLGEINGEKAHQLLHTHYRNRRRIEQDGISLTSTGEAKIPVSVCVGTGCFLRGSQELLRGLMHHVADADLEERVDVRATFCMEACDRGPTVRVNGHVLHHASLEATKELVQSAIEGRLAPASAPATCHCH